MNQPSRGRYTPGAVGAIGGALVIALGLLAVSYGHVHAFARAAGAKAWEAAIIAGTVDGLIVVALGALGVARARGVASPWQVRAALVVGVAATTAANVHHGADYGWRGVVLALWSPLVAELAYQLAMWAIVHGRVAEAEVEHAVAEAVDQAPAAERVEGSAEELAPAPAADQDGAAAEPVARWATCGEPRFALEVVEEQLAQLAAGLRDAEAIAHVLEIQRHGGDIALRPLAARYGRTVHWATGIKREAADRLAAERAVEGELVEVGG